MNSLPEASDLSTHLNNQNQIISHPSQPQYITVISDSNDPYHHIPVRQITSDNIIDHQGLRTSNIVDHQGLRTSNLQYLSPIASTERIDSVYE